MDPTANLEEQRRIVARILAGTFLDQEEHDEAAERLAELVAALDQWVSRGGFLPAPWAANRTAVDPDRRCAPRWTVDGRMVQCRFDRDHEGRCRSNHSVSAGDDR